VGHAASATRKAATSSLAFGIKRSRPRLRCAATAAQLRVRLAASGSRYAAAAGGASVAYVRNYHTYAPCV
jgi:hypothetical protein